MSAHVSNYPRRVLVPSGSQPTAGRGGSLVPGALLLGGLVMLVATTAPREGRASDATQRGSAMSVRAADEPVLFSVQAQGITVREVSVYEVPGAVMPGTELPSGTPVEIGGQLRVASGMGLHALNWVRVHGPEGLRYGFVPAEAVRLTAGEPALLDGSDLSAARWARPQAAASYSGGEVDLSAASAMGSTMASADSEASQQTPAIAWMPASVVRWWEDIQQAARRHDVDPQLVAIIVLVESGGDPEAKSPAGATGLMQLMPATARELAGQAGMSDFGQDRLTDPRTNIELGTAYVAQQLKRFGQTSDPDWQASVELAAAAYNGGPGTVTAMQDGSRGLPAETRRYVTWVGGMWRERRLAESTTFKQWWSAGGLHLVQGAERRLAALP